MHPSVDERITPLPRELSNTDKSTNITIKSPFLCENNELYRRGSVRSSNPIPSTCHIYYYEVNFIIPGGEKDIAIGLTSGGSNINRYPGIEKNTIGYGNNGMLYYESLGREYGPSFSTDDIIGCGINLGSKTCFFTKNGKALGTARSNMPNISWFPTIALWDKAVVEVNFGQKPFMYNINTK